jgi:hypothetical protein
MFPMLLRYCASSQTLELYPKNLNDGSGTPEFQGNIFEQLLGDKGDGAQAYYNGKLKELAGALSATGKYVPYLSLSSSCAHCLC